jgi:hypothetical protein
MKRLTLFLLGIFVSFNVMAGADEPFFVKDQCYLYIPRIDIVAKGQVTKVTDQELVIKNLGTIWVGKDPIITKINKNKWKITQEMENYPEKKRIMDAYLSGTDAQRAKLERWATGMEWSYSRAAMTAVKLDRCGK